jgi:hypothetical protein
MTLLRLLIKIACYNLATTRIDILLFHFGIICNLFFLFIANFFLINP